MTLKIHPYKIHHTNLGVRIVSFMPLTWLMCVYLGNPAFLLYNQNLYFEFTHKSPAQFNFKTNVNMLCL